ncbi:MAG TPA: DinB family protein [Thermoanaerobaculia bacterium]|nr:DinB family protein [Thermoanaerobaculia bacterium]
MKSGRPKAGEFAEYATSDIENVAGDDAVEALRSQSREIVALLDRVDERSVAGLAYAPGKWTFKQVIGHLIDDERIFGYRALCVARREPRPLPGFDEKEYMKATDFEHRALASLKAEYRAVRESSIAFFESLTADEWLRKGEVNGYMASVRGLAFHICGHELHHLRTIREKYLT